MSSKIKGKGTEGREEVTKTINNTPPQVLIVEEARQEKARNSAR